MDLSLQSQLDLEPSWLIAAMSMVQTLAALPLAKKYALYEDIDMDSRANYFAISVYPITTEAEDDMEMISDLVTWGELYLDFWQPGVYLCARCGNRMYRSEDKWKGEGESIVRLFPSSAHLI